jgi:hypothetical protein
MKTRKGLVKKEQGSAPVYVLEKGATFERDVRAHMAELVAKGASFSILKLLEGAGTNRSTLYTKHEDGSHVHKKLMEDIDLARKSLAKAISVVEAVAVQPVVGKREKVLVGELHLMRANLNKQGNLLKQTERDLRHWAHCAYVMALAYQKLTKAGGLPPLIRTSIAAAEADFGLGEGATRAEAVRAAGDLVRELRPRVPTGVVRPFPAGSLPGDAGDRR